MYHYHDPTATISPMYHVYPQYSVVEPAPKTIHTSDNNCFINIEHSILDIEPPAPPQPPPPPPPQHRPAPVHDGLGSVTLAVDKPKESSRTKANGPVDTSSYTIEERLVAAVWVHERKRHNISIGQIKRDFKQRFGRDAPAKNTLVVWEKKLFSTGSVSDAPRPGRPSQRRSQMAAVSASVRSSPALSLRARAAALRLPRTTLRTILRTDLHLTPSLATLAPTDNKKSAKKSSNGRVRGNTAPPAAAAPPSAPASHPRPTQAHYM